ncbi:MAG TPA: phospholipase D-like domain-containing protein [Opitutaceae bacterium]|nr:phospholipase D-like domain-containing protein [Opitutaceae bacterium]
MSVFIVFGVVGYFWLTTAKILGTPIDLAFGPEDARFPGTMGPLLGAEFSRGNSVKTMINGDNFFPVMLEAIRDAKKTVSLETYIWSSGKVSDQFIDALSDRAKHGVVVNVLADGMGTLKFSHDEERRMKDAGVNFIIYGRKNWWDVKPNINHRTHRKILVIDGRVGFTGGMCIDDHWLGSADSEKVWRETMVKFEGPAVLELQATFASNWLQTTGILLIGPDYFPKPEAAGDSVANVYKSGPSENPENARVAYMMAIASARKSIKIANAYFVPDDLAIEMLLRAKKRGVRIQVIVPAINDSKIGRAASRSRWGPLLQAGVEFYRYMPAMYHPKVMIVDDVFVTVGSVNFDNRSFSINDEVALNVIDRDVARDHVRAFEHDLKFSEPYSFSEYDNRGAFQKMLDQAAGLLRSQL